MDENKRVGMIKDWLAWVIRETYSQRVVDYLPFKNKLMTALALRQTFPCPGLSHGQQLLDQCFSAPLPGGSALPGQHIEVGHLKL
jgi:hypothetical protein